MREPSRAKTTRNPIQREERGEILAKLHQASEAIKSATVSQIEFQSLENPTSLDIDDDTIIDKALKKDPDFSKIQKLIKFSNGFSQQLFQEKLEREETYISNLDQLIERKKTESDYYQEGIKILSHNADIYDIHGIESFSQGAKVRDQFNSDSQGAKVRESLDRPKSQGAMGANTPSFEEDKKKLMTQIQLLITTLTLSNPGSERLRSLKILSSTVSECNTESKFRKIEKEINPQINYFLRKFEIKNLENEIEKKTLQLEKEKARKQADAKAEKEAKAKVEKQAEAKAKRKAEAKAKREVEEKAKREVEEKAKLEAEAEKARLEAEEKKDKENKKKSKSRKNKSIS